MESYRYVGYAQPPEETALFAKPSIDAIIQEIGTNFPGKVITIKPDIVRGLLETNYYDYRPPITDIYSMYQINLQPSTDNKITRARAITINMIVSTIASQLADQAALEQLDIDIIKYADQLRAPPVPNLKNRRVPPMQFNMNY